MILLKILYIRINMTNFFLSMGNKKKKTIIGGTEFPKYRLNNSLIEKMNNLE
jgi:hypothetical protein